MILLHFFSSMFLFVFFPILDVFRWNFSDSYRLVSPSELSLVRDNICCCQPHDEMFFHLFVTCFSCIAFSFCWSHGEAVIILHRISLVYCLFPSQLFLWIIHLSIHRLVCFKMDYLYAKITAFRGIWHWRQNESRRIYNATELLIIICFI